MPRKYMYQEYRVKELIRDTIDKVMMRLEGGEVDNGNEIEITIGNGDEEYDNYSDADFFYSQESISNGDLARAHWIQLQKTNQQGLVMRSIMLHIIEENPHLRPLWQFSRNINEEGNAEWKATLNEDFYFRHQCASIRAAVSMVMENKEDPQALKKLLNEIGVHHFFYDTTEAHLEVFQDSFIGGMRKVLTSPNELDQPTEESWMALLNMIKAGMGEGIAIARANYLVQCVTIQEMNEIRQMIDKWSQIENFGLQEAGELLCETAVTSYAKLLKNHNLRMPVLNLRKDRETFKKFARQTILALDKTIRCYQGDCGFADLPEQMKDYVVSCLVLDVCPTLIRKAFNEGIVEMLTKVLNGMHLSPAFLGSMNKIYRVMEQAAIVNIIDY